MKLKDLELLKKTMDRTASDNDAEALAALRASNRILEKGDGRGHVYTWSQVLSRVVQASADDFEEDPEPAPERPKKAKGMDEGRINAALEIVLDSAEGSFRDTILSFQAQWHNRGWLSPRQQEVLFRAADRQGVR